MESNYIVQNSMDEITYPCPNFSQIMSRKGTPDDSVSIKETTQIRIEFLHIRKKKAFALFLLRVPMAEGNGLRWVQFTRHEWLCGFSLLLCYWILIIIWWFDVLFVENILLNWIRNSKDYWLSYITSYNFVK